MRRPQRSRCHCGAALASTVTLVFDSSAAFVLGVEPLIPSDANANVIPSSFFIILSP